MDNIMNSWAFQLVAPNCIYFVLHPTNRFVRRLWHGAVRRTRRWGSRQRWAISRLCGPQQHHQNCTFRPIVPAPNSAKSMPSNRNRMRRNRRRPTRSAAVAHVLERLRCCSQNQPGAAHTCGIRANAARHRRATDGGPTNAAAVSKCANGRREER